MRFVKVTYTMCVRYYYLGSYTVCTRDFAKRSRLVTKLYYLTENTLRCPLKYDEG